MNTSNNNENVKTESFNEESENCTSCNEEEHCDCAQCQNRTQNKLIKTEFDDENNWVFVEKLTDERRVNEREKNTSNDEAEQEENIVNNNRNVSVKNENLNTDNVVLNTFSIISNHRKQRKQGKIYPILFLKF